MTQAFQLGYRYAWHRALLEVWVDNRPDLTFMPYVPKQGYEVLRQVIESGLYDRIKENVNKENLAPEFREQFIAGVQKALDSIQEILP